MSLKFWDAAEKRRKKIQEGMGGASVIDLYRGVLAQEQEHDASYDEVEEVVEDEYKDLEDDDFDRIDALREQAMDGIDADREQVRGG